MWFTLQWTKIADLENGPMNESRCKCISLQRTCCIVMYVFFSRGSVGWCGPGIEFQMRSASKALQLCRSEYVTRFFVAVLYWGGIGNDRHMNLSCHTRSEKQTNKEKTQLPKFWIFGRQNDVTYCKKTHVLHFDDFHLLKYVSPYLSGKLCTSSQADVVL